MRRRAFLAVASIAFGSLLAACVLPQDESGASSCPPAHASTADLEAMMPGQPSDSERVRLLRQPCAASEFGTSEAALYFDYATDLAPDAAARQYIDAAKAEGWKVANPPAGKRPEMVDGRIHLVFGRADSGGDLSLVGTVFLANPPPSGNGEGLDKIIASGKKTGMSFWMQSGGASAVPTFDISKGLFPTPDPGVGR